MIKNDGNPYYLIHSVDIYREFTKQQSLRYWVSSINKNNISSLTHSMPATVIRCYVNLTKFKPTLTTVEEAETVALLKNRLSGSAWKPNKISTQTKFKIKHFIHISYI
jgi:hypothetical protein